MYVLVFSAHYRGFNSRHCGTHWRCITEVQFMALCLGLRDRTSHNDIEFELTSACCDSIMNYPVISTVIDLL